MKTHIKKLTLLSVCISTLSLMSFGCKPTDHKLPKDNIRLAVYNIRGEDPNDGVNLWKFRKDSLIKIVLKNNMEIVGLQEAVQFQLEDIVAELRISS